MAIRLLPDALINQIAAGEVVERPASVVKELCENALDAGARSLRVELSEGGLSLIQVADDGCGMGREDALSALARHATSKLVDAEGLLSIATMGFRGEAIPAIASVSRFTMTTRDERSPFATRIAVEGGRVESVEEAGAPVGTTIRVADLFFNTPARRKFLKRAETESGHAAEAVVRLALARPDVAFSLTSGGRQSFAAAADARDPRERIAAALGAELFEHLLPLDERRGELRVAGYVASPEYTLGTARGIYTFVNGRYVRDRALIAAVQRAYADVLMPGRQPVVVLDLRMPYALVDVNVHPQKLEVRFAESRRVFEAIHSAIQRRLGASPWLGAQAQRAPEQGQERVGGLPPSPVERALAFAPGLSQPYPPAAPTLDAGNCIAEEGALAREEQPRFAPRAPGVIGFYGSLRVIGQFARTYLLCEGAGPRLLIVDQHAAHERLKFHALREAYRARAPQRQSFLFPLSVELPPAEARALTARLEEVRRMGFELEPFGGNAFALHAVPAPLVGGEHRKLLLELAGELLQVEEGRALDEAMEEVLATMACHSAVRAHHTLSNEEAYALLAQLDGIDFATRCPHGRPIAMELTLDALEREVGRR